MESPAECPLYTSTLFTELSTPWEKFEAKTSTVRLLYASTAPLVKNLIKIYCYDSSHIMLASSIVADLNEVFSMATTFTLSNPIAPGLSWNFRPLRMVNGLANRNAYTMTAPPPSASKIT